MFRIVCIVLCLIFRYKAYLWPMLLTVEKSGWYI